MNPDGNTPFTTIYSQGKTLNGKILGGGTYHLGQKPIFRGDLKVLKKQ